MDKKDEEIERLRDLLRKSREWLYRGECDFDLINEVEKELRMSTSDYKPDRPNYHGLEIETAKLPRTSLANLPHGLSVTYCRVTGWELWYGIAYQTSRPLAGEYSDNWLRLYVGETVIVDSSPETSRRIISDHFQTRIEKEASNE